MFISFIWFISLFSVIYLISNSKMCRYFILVYLLLILSSNSWCSSHTNVHTLKPGQSFQSNPTRKSEEFHILCYKGQPKNIMNIWQSVILQLHTTSDDFTVYEGASPEEVEKEYIKKLSFWSFNIFSISSNHKNIKLPPFDASCLGIESKEKYSAVVHVIKIDFWKVLLLAIGVLTYLSADTLSKNNIFHYVCGVTFGITTSFLILIYFISKLFPKKPFMYGVLGCGWTIIIYVLQLLWENLQTILTSYKFHLVWYIIGVGVVSFIVCYRWGPVENQRTINLIRWCLQIIAVLSIFNSTQYQEAALAQVVLLLLACNVPHSWKILPKSYWRKKFPPRVNLLTEEEFHQQSIVETSKALHQLRDYCLSPDCNQWKTILRLKDAKRFASFIEGSPHLSDEEILDYETTFQRTSTDDEENDFTDEEDYD